MDLNRFVSEVSEIEEIGDLDAKVLCLLVQKYGFSAATYGNCMVGGTDIERAFEYSTAPDVWWAYYLGENYQHCDPVYAVMPYFGDLFAWEQARNATNGRGDACLDDAIDAGLTNGMTLSLKRPGEYHAISIAGRPEPLDVVGKMEVQALLQIYHDRRMLLTPDRLTFGLAPREIEYLSWASSGKTNREIAEICGVSDVAVQKRLKSAFEKLASDSRGEACIRAAGFGVVRPRWLGPPIR